MVRNSMGDRRLGDAELRHHKQGGVHKDDIQVDAQGWHYQNNRTGVGTGPVVHHTHADRHPEPEQHTVSLVAVHKELRTPEHRHVAEDGAGIAGGEVETEGDGAL